MKTLDAPKGSRITLKVVKVETKPTVPSTGRSAITDYVLTDADGHEHLWHSSHLFDRPYGSPPYIPEGDGSLLLTATVDGVWVTYTGGRGPEPKGYHLVRGRFSRGTDTAEPVEIVRHRW